MLDLFGGVGGFSLGAARAGFSIVGSVDNDPHAIKLLRINFPNTLHLQADVNSLTSAEIRTFFKIEKNELDGVIGGPPCQGFSHIGQNDKDDPRNELFVHFFKIVADLKPIFFLVENVPGLLAEKNSRFLKAAYSLIDGHYDMLPPMNLAAHRYGAPTNRTRIFLFGYCPGRMSRLSVDDFQPKEETETVLVRDAFKGLSKKINPDWQAEEDGWRKIGKAIDNEFGLRLQGLIPHGVGDDEAIDLLKKERLVSGCLGTRHTQEVLKRFASIKQGEKDNVSKCIRLKYDGFCPTLRAGTGSDHGSYQAVRPLHPTENRVITPREAARLQGFPDWFQFSPTKWHSFRLIGNSVSPILAESIFAVIYNALDSKT